MAAGVAAVVIWVVAVHSFFRPLLAIAPVVVFAVVLLVRVLLAPALARRGADAPGPLGFDEMARLYLGRPRQEPAGRATDQPTGRADERAGEHPAERGVEHAAQHAPARGGPDLADPAATAVGREEQSAGVLGERSEAAHGEPADVGAQQNR
ncbi:hypothetical protein [Cellulomonas edaphi]|uniref:DUF983 domain-containing protein n=1 Tax=Cellulomonas edaphi TaxID=3053468 RepID=A0ABT7S4G1_9CELL|nr:hypothetical protein [Cellulomons edaphi]MDM7830507.1 hypothetical protein [Cellulomons edaphi]